MYKIFHLESGQWVKYGEFTTKLAAQLYRKVQKRKGTQVIIRDDKKRLVK